MALPDQETLRRRVKAARQLAGYSVAELSEAVGENARLGERTLRKLEGGESPLQMPHLRAIADACFLPVEFFTVENIGVALLAGTTLTEEMVDKPQPGADFQQAFEEMRARMEKLEQTVYTGVADSVDSTRVATGLTRRAKGAAAASAGADPETQADTTARDARDASAEASQPAPARKRRSARGNGR